jgi:hypothetical protein
MKSFAVIVPVAGALISAAFAAGAGAASGPNSAEQRVTLEKLSQIDELKRALHQLGRKNQQ